MARMMCGNGMSHCKKRFVNSDGSAMGYCSRFETKGPAFEIGSEITTSICPKMNLKIYSGVYSTKIL